MQFLKLVLLLVIIGFLGYFFSEYAWPFIEKQPRHVWTFTLICWGASVLHSLTGKLLR
jgi:hypothetical protein